MTEWNYWLGDISNTYFLTCNVQCHFGFFGALVSKLVLNVEHLCHCNCHTYCCRHAYHQGQYFDLLRTNDLCGILIVQEKKNRSWPRKSSGCQGQYSESWELGTAKGLSKTALNSEVVLFLRSISAYWIGIKTAVAVLNFLKTGFTVTTETLFRIVWGTECLGHSYAAIVFHATKSHGE